MPYSYCIPKRVPKWVMGFSDHLLAHGYTDPNILVMQETWQQYQESDWENFAECGKPRKQREKASDTAAQNLDAQADGMEAEHYHQQEEEPPVEQRPTHISPTLRSTLKMKLLEMKRIASKVNNQELNFLVDDFERLFNR